MSEDVLQEWNELCQEYQVLEETNILYLKKFEELTRLQHECSKGIAHQRYRIQSIEKSLGELSDENEEEIESVKQNILKRQADLEVIERGLPKKTELYLRLALGNINVSFLDSEERFRYKDEYEKFKLVIHVVAFFAVCILFYFPFRPLELLYICFLIWYYLTITIRESILIANGSRIKGWWRIHHVISTAASVIFLVWPDDEIWQQFRNHFIWYNIYTCFITYLQFKYQRGALYRLKALGERYNMDITIEGFHSWMWRGLTFLLPFLFVGYIFQLVNAFVLYRLSCDPRASWQVSLSSVAFIILFIGNTTTTMMVIPDKIKHKMILRYKILRGRDITEH